MILIDACPSASELVLPKGMDHIEFDFCEDFTNPLANFLERCGVLEYEKVVGSKITFPRAMFLPPESVLEQLKDQTAGKRRDRNNLTKSYDTNILKDNELMSSKLAKRSILGF